MSARNAYRFNLTCRLLEQDCAPSIEAKFNADADAIPAAHAIAYALALCNACDIRIKIAGSDRTDIGIVAGALEIDRFPIERQHSFGADYEGPSYPDQPGNKMNIGPNERRDSGVKSFGSVSV